MNEERVVTADRQVYHHVPWIIYRLRHEIDYSPTHEEAIALAAEVEALRYQAAGNAKWFQENILRKPPSRFRARLQRIFPFLILWLTPELWEALTKWVTGLPFYPH